MILAIETSCDETSVAVTTVDGQVLSLKTRTQIASHLPYGGIVPEIAARDHLALLLPVIDAALAEARITADDLTAIGVTQGPGLIGALLIGVQTAESMGAALGIPVYGINHLLGHLLSEPVEPDGFPVLALLVSGGHTQLYRLDSVTSLKLLGQTRDDAAGEALDKAAKLLGLPYPGGASLTAAAERGQPDAYPLPRPLRGQKTMDMSFAGLKSAFALTAREVDLDDPRIVENMAASFLQAVIETLTERVEMALQQAPYRTVLLTGGVAACIPLRAKIERLASGYRARFKVPPQSLCTDNAAMIAYVTAQKIRAGEPPSASLDPKSRWPVGETGVLA